MTTETKTPATFVDQKLVKEETGIMIDEIFAKHDKLNELHVGMVAHHNNQHMTVAAMSFYGNETEEVLGNFAHGPASELAANKENPLHGLTDSLTNAKSIFEASFKVK